MIPRRSPAAVEGIWLLVLCLAAFLVAALLRGLQVGRTAIVVNAGLGLAVTIVPLVVSRRTDVVVPLTLVAWAAFAASAHVGGLVFGLYAPPTRFDVVTHAISGGAVGATSVYLLRCWRRRVEILVIPAWFGTLAVLLAVMGAGVLWEMVEFTVSGGAGGLQISLADTMTDLVVNLIGGAVGVGLGMADWDPALESSRAADPSLAEEPGTEGD